jgi:hypothetical protein
MSRAGYSDDYEQWAQICWRGAVASALRGKRGQAFLREMLAALDALPEKRLIVDELVKGGAVCAIGAVGKARGIDMTNMDPLDWGRLSNTFGIAESMVREIEYENDEAGRTDETPEARFIRVRGWVERQLIEWEPS